MDQWWLLTWACYVSTHNTLFHHSQTRTGKFPQISTGGFPSCWTILPLLSREAVSFLRLNLGATVGKNQWYHLAWLTSYMEETTMNRSILNWPLVSWTMQSSLNCCWSCNKISICFPAKCSGMRLPQLVSLHGILYNYKPYCDQPLRGCCKPNRKKSRFLRNKLNWLLQFSLRCARAACIYEKYGVIISVDFIQSS